MGYTLTIGQAVVSWDSEHVCVDAECVSLDGAPHFGEPTDGTNERWPSYSNWGEACRRLGITEVMFGDPRGEQFEYDGEWLTPLIAEHPGVAPVTQAHVDIVEAAISAYKAANPGHIAAYPLLRPGVERSVVNRPEDYIDDPSRDGWLVRGEWLLFWLKWAVENCDKPVFRNT